LGGDCYQLKIRQGSTVYRRPQLFRAALPWQYPVLYFTDWNMCRLQGHQQDLVQLTPERYDEMSQYLGSELKCYLLWFNSD
jgi:hypothetical protein